MTVGRITADDAIQWIMECVAACPLTSDLADNRIGFELEDLTDEDGKVTASEDRKFGWYEVMQNDSDVCFGAESIAVTLVIAYQHNVITQDLVELKNYLRYKAPTKAGVIGFNPSQAIPIGPDTGESTILVEMPVMIEYLPLKSQGE